MENKIGEMPFHLNLNRL